MAELNPIDLRFNIPSVQKQSDELKALLKKQSDEHTALLKKQWDAEKQYGANVGVLKATGLKQVSELETKHASQKQALLDKQLKAEQDHTLKVQKWHSDLVVKSNALNSKYTEQHQRELDKQAKAEEAHALKIMKYHNMVVKNSLALGDNQRGLREIIAGAIGKASGGTLAGLTTGQLGMAGGITAGVFALKSLGEAGLEADARLNKLRAGLEGSGTAVQNLDQRTNVLVQTTKKLANTYSVNNIQLQEATSHFLELGGSQDDLARKQQAIILLSEKAGISLHDAAGYAVKGFSEDLNLRLTRFGIALDKNLPPAEQFNEFMRQGAPLLDAIAKRFDTAAARAERAKNSWEDMKEGIGSFVVNSVANMKTWAEKMDESLDKVFGTQNAEEKELDRLAAGGKKRTDEEIKQIDAIAAHIRHGESAWNDYFTAEAKAKGIDAGFAQFAPGYKGTPSTTSVDVKAALQQKLTDLTTDLENKRAVAVQAMEDHNKDAQKAAEKEVKIAGDKVNALQAEFDRQNKIGGQIEEKKGKSAETIQREKYDKEKKDFDNKNAIESLALLEKLANDKKYNEKLFEEDDIRLKISYYERLILLAKKYNQDWRTETEALLHIQVDIHRREQEELREHHKLLLALNIAYKQVYESQKKDENELTRKIREYNKEEQRKAREEEIAEEKKTIKELRSTIDSLDTKAFDRIFKPIEDSLKKDKSLIGDMGQELLKLAEKKLVTFIGEQLFPDKDKDKKPEALANRDALMKHLSIDKSDIAISTASVTILQNSPLNPNISNDNYIKAINNSSGLNSFQEKLLNSNKINNGNGTNFQVGNQNTQYIPPNRLIGNGSGGTDEQNGTIKQGNIPGSIVDENTDKVIESVKKIYKNNEQFIELVETLEAAVHGHANGGIINAFHSHALEGMDDSSKDAIKKVDEAGFSSNKDNKDIIDPKETGRKMAGAFSQGLISAVKNKDTKSIVASLLGEGLSIGASVLTGGISKALGFADGGYTGGKTGEPRGIVHGDEWVFNRPQMSSMMKSFSTGGVGSNSNTTVLHSEMRETNNLLRQLVAKKEIFNPYDTHSAITQNINERLAGRF